MDRLRWPLIGGLILSALAAQAATIHVPGDYPTIQEGVDAAVAGDTVMVACGTYYLTDPVWIETDGICLRSETGDAGCVTIDGQDQWPGFWCFGLDSSTTILGFTFTNCVGAGGAHTQGGGMTVSGSPWLESLVFIGNTASFGGGLFCENGSLTLTNARFVDNGGSAMYTLGADPVLIDVEFKDNEGVETGGGMECEGGAPILQGVRFIHNSANYGGGMYMDASSPVLTDVAFIENTVRVTGGGLYCYSASTPQLTDVLFLANSAESSGGGMFCRSDCAPTLTDVRFRANDAYNGGGVACEDASPAFVRTSFEENTATFGGGMVVRLASSPTLDQVTFARNGAPVTSGILISNTSHVEATRTIIAYGQRGGMAVRCADTASATLTCCDVFGNTGGDWIYCIAGQGGQNGNFSADPLFCMDDNPNDPYSIHADSPCAPAQSPPGCGLIGGRDVGCMGEPSTDVPGTPRETTWGVIKRLFR